MSRSARFRWSLVALLVAIVPKIAAAETGSIAGHLSDQRGQRAYVGRATVFLCDAETGLPLVASTKKKLSPSSGTMGITELWHTETDDRGVFQFEDVPIGDYRLVAQSWSGTVGLPSFEEKPSTVVLLHGTAESVSVQAGAVAQAWVRPIGTGVLTIRNDPEEAHAFLLISRKPTLGDGILGPPGWGREFLTHLVGVTRMERPYVTIIGLPNDQDIHVGLFNYDNNPGVGADTYRVGEEPVVRLRILASWSNGKYEPPQRLAKLVDHMEKEKLTVSQLMDKEGTDNQNQTEIYRRLQQESDRHVEVPGLGDFRFADVLAASNYVRLRAAHRARKVRAGR